MPSTAGRNVESLGCISQRVGRSQSSTRPSLAEPDFRRQLLLTLAALHKQSMRSRDRETATFVDSNMGPLML